MSLNKLTVELAEKSNFSSKYLEICERYNDDLLGTSDKIVDNKMVEPVLDSLGYQYRYFKDEKFYRVCLLKRSSYEVRFHLILYKESSFDGFLDPHIYIRKDKKYFAGSVFPELFEAAGGIAPTKYVLRPVYTADILSELIKELVELALSYVHEFSELN